MSVPGRQALFSGTEPAPAHLALNTSRLAPYLAARIAALGEHFTVEKFKGGQSNPTYKLSSADISVVLRRRPPGALLKSAHDIEREYRVLSALKGANYPSPRTYCSCSDQTIIGSEFYIASFNEGRVFWDAELPGETPDDRRSIYDDMNRRLAELHTLDYSAIGLAAFAKVGDYAARNLARWSKVYSESKLIDIPDMDWLISTLPEMLPGQERTCLIHGDYGLYNIILEPSAPRLSAVLDWEMSTLGDPLIDLAHNLRAWWELPDPDGRAATSLAGRDLATLGIPTMDRYIDTYCRRMHLTELPHRRFYLGYVQFRYAAMVQGILKRAAIGTASSRADAHRQERVPAIAALARATLEGRGGG